MEAAAGPQAPAGETATPNQGGATSLSGGAGANGSQPPDFSAWSPEQIRAWGDVQHATAGQNAEDRSLVFRQLHVALALILGGAIVATVGILLVKESAATKLTAIISISTAVIGVGAALLPTGAAAGASARILARGTGDTPATAVAGAGAVQSANAGQGAHSNGHG